jgi:hypothetical protein
MVFRCFSITRTLTFRWLWLLGLILPGCDWINPEEPIPAYLRIEAVRLSTDLNEGSDSENITEAWVFIDGDFLGAFAIPSTIPVYREGQTEVRIEAGSRENGSSSTPDIYPFYAPYREDLNLTPGQTSRISALVTYRSEARFAFIEDFEAGNSLFRERITGTDQSRIQISQESPFEGNRMGLIELGTDDPFVEIATVPRYRGLLDDGNSVYLELNYRADTRASFGIVGYRDSNPLPLGTAYAAGFNPSEEWNKIYFNLTETIFTSEVDEVQIVIRAGLPLREDGTFAAESGRIELDNIKLLHF